MSMVSMVQVVMPGFQDAGGTKYVANEWNSLKILTWAWFLLLLMK